MHIPISFYLLVILTVLIVGIIIWVTISIMLKHKKMMREKIIHAEQLQEMLQQIKSDNVSAYDTIKGLQSTKNELFEKLCGIVLRNNDEVTIREKIADTIIELINSHSIKGAKVQELAREVDDMYNNLYTDFRKDLPDLKEADYCLFLFTVLGFSNVTISLFLQENKVNAVYDRKRRLKDKIKKLDKTKSQRYLEWFS